MIARKLVKKVTPGQKEKELPHGENDIMVYCSVIHDHKLNGLKQHFSLSHSFRRKYSMT